VKQVQWIFYLWFLFFLFLYSPLVSAPSVNLPGFIDHYIIYFKNYMLTEQNVIYHLNENLLFEEMPDFTELSTRMLRGITSPHKRRSFIPIIMATYKKTTKMTQTYKLKNIFSCHREIKSRLGKTTSNHPRKISIDLKTPEGYNSAAELLEQIGLILKTDANLRYYLEENITPPHFNINDYYQILGFNTWTLAGDLNRTHQLDLNISEFAAHIPRDLEFFRFVSNSKITADSFAEFLTQEKRLQLFLGLLYRLSDREINYIDRLAEYHFDSWRTIYNDNSFLTGMFILSHALRVKNDQLCLPGGPEALPFWEKLVGVNYREHPLRFLERLAVKDNGKLNFYFVFTFFLPKKIQKAFLFNFNVQRFREIYDLVDVPRTRKLSKLEIPGIEDFSFFTLMAALKVRDNTIDFPGGIDTWAAATGAAETNFSGLLRHLMNTSTKENSLKRFISIYSKFQQREELLTETVLRTLYNNYDEYNVLVDFMEKIPLKKPETVLKLFWWVKKLEGANLAKKEKTALTAVFQSLLEILSIRAKYRPDQFQYDQLIEELTQIPLSAVEAYNGFFHYLENHLHIDLNPTNVDQAFLEFLSPGIENTRTELTIRQQTYFLESSSILKEEIFRILDSQGACHLSDLVKINHLLESLLNSKHQHSSTYGYRKITGQLITALEALPFPERGDNMPDYLQNFIEEYSREAIFKRLNKLIAMKKPDTSGEKIDSLTEKIKTTCLLQELKHYLVTCVYAATIKHSKLQLFLNPNLIRFHDFSAHQGKTPWNTSGISYTLDNFNVYHLEGGLSRLNITLAFPFSEYIFGMTSDSDSSLRVPMIFNILDMYPHALINQAQEYTGLLVKFGDELLQKARKNPNLCQELLDELTTMTAGYRYRTVLDTLDRKSGRSPQLHFSELLRLGERYFNMNKFVETFSQKERLKAFQNPTTTRSVHSEMERLGCIYYHTFGTLKPHRYSLFPQSLSHLFQSGWIGGEMINEFKIKAAYISSCRQMPPQLLGHFVWNFFMNESYLFHPNYKNEYHKAYFMYSTFNYLYLNRIFRRLRENGTLRIK
jgi:hypothetical protein